MTRRYSAKMAERAIQKFSDDYFNEIALPKGGAILQLLASSRAEAADALVALITASPENADRIRELQNKIMMHLNLLRWTGRAVNEGEQIYAQLEIEDREDIQLAVLTRGGDAKQMIGE